MKISIKSLMYNKNKHSIQTTGRFERCVELTTFAISVTPGFGCSFMNGRIFSRRGLVNAIIPIVETKPW